jgi:hypothetical protein
MRQDAFEKLLVGRFIVVVVLPAQTPGQRVDEERPLLVTLRCRGHEDASAQDHFDVGPSFRTQFFSHLSLGDSFVTGNEVEGGIFALRNHDCHAGNGHEKSPQSNGPQDISVHEPLLVCDPPSAIDAYEITPALRQV